LIRQKILAEMPFWREPADAELRLGARRRLGHSPLD
jgi:hypothetical protein